MTPERGNPAGDADPVDRLQTALKVTSAEAQDFANIAVECPYPAEAGEAERVMSLADFMASEHGAAHAERILETAKMAIKHGVGAEESLEMALTLSGTIRDPETGRLPRMTEAQREAAARDQAEKKSAPERA